MSADNPDLSFSIITPAYNNPKEVGRLLDSIRAEASNDKSLEVIVVDDCSKGDALRQVVEDSGFARYIRLENNSGPAAARNVGAKSARNEILLFVDSDIIFDSDTLSRIRDRFEKDRSLDIICGEYDLEPANPSMSTKFKSLMVRSWAPKEDFVTDFLTRVGAIRRRVFDRVGGFDTGVRTASIEDYEFARRLIDKGYIIHYDPDITVKHHFPTFEKQVNLFFHRSFMWVYVFGKYFKFDNTCTTPLQGVAQASGFLAFFFLILAIVNRSFIYIALFFLVLFIAGMSRFFRLTLKHEGLVFTLFSLPMAMVIASSVVLGALWGIAYHFLFKTRR